MFYVYLLKSKKDNSIYIGYTDNLKTRIKQHNNGESRFTKNKLPWELVYCEIYKAKPDAKYREKNLKRFAQAFVQLKKRIKNSLV
jgi:putative endonuclease